MTTRNFGAAEQAAFAELSGDYNPMHMDPLLARRLQTGGTVVHGVHAALWALDVIAGQGLIPDRVASIACRFAKFIRLGSDVALRVVRANADGALVHLETDGLVTTLIELRTGPREAAADTVQPTLPLPQQPEERDVPEMAGLARRLAAPRPLAAYGAAFPHLADAIGAERIAGLTLLSAIVGMVCPGLHSIFDSFEVALAEPTGQAAVSFQVEAADRRFRQVRMNVKGCGLSGSVKTFVRHPLPRLPSMAALAQHVRPEEFSGTRALVIGGSRGLGALTAKLIAAGGGDVVVTYAQGKDDAAALAEEIAAFAARRACTTRRFDVLADDPAELASAVGPVHDMYYFATAQIFRQKAALYLPSLLREFLQIYADGFQACCLALLQAGRLAAFYPSTTFLEKRQNQFTEYCMAKAAGEVLCADLARYTPNLQVMCKRLPRMLTDQTATVALAKSEDPLSVMLPIVREMQALRADAA
jgi:acyl dehydratase/NAD(P)-dependent dehydrogenase (short-subunit alcohol dehydrogenase family)